MDSQKVFDIITQDQIVAGMRGAFKPDVALRTVETLMAYDIRVFELTMNSEQPIAAMQAIKRNFGDDVVAGMGTVLDVQTAQKVLDAGADFIVSPAFQPDVVQVVLNANVLVAPGVTTPSEAVAAWSMGVPLLKIFPIGALGLDYFKAVIGPLNHMKFMCNGGMNAENAPQFLEAGAVACGMAGWLTGNGTMSTETLQHRASQLQAAIRRVRGEHRVV